MADTKLISSRMERPKSTGIYHYYNTDIFYSVPNMYHTRKMDGIKRVIVFCILIVVLPVSLIVLPLYLRNTVFADVVYPVAESDIIEIRDGISSLFCQRHSLHMSSSFNAFQLSSMPETSTNRKHIRLKKSMTLPDDTLEYWGFYLLKGAKVNLRFCSRYDGSRILVVKGQRDLQTCGLLDHNKNKVGANFAQGHEQVKVFFEDIAEIAVNIAPDELEHNQKNYTNNDELEHENHGGEVDDDIGGGEVHQDESKANSAVASARNLNKKIKFHKHSEQMPSSTSNTVRSEHADALRASAKITKHFEIKEANENALHKHRSKREHVYDRKYSHGGNALNFTPSDESTSISSFENGLFECYAGAILLAEGFPPSSECINANFLENGSHRMSSKHEITEDGYYYYIFYSDNDLVRNDIHAIFDIYKPTFQYSNLNDLQACVNVTNCTFPISFLSDDFVVVEVPTRDGIEHEEDDITLLISTCHPRTVIYAIFPITVLILILSCAFL